MNMKTSENVSGLWILLTVFLSFHLQTVCSKSCDVGQQCVLLSSCPELAALLRSNKREDIDKVRSNICGFEGRRSKVCCSSSVTTTTTESSSFQLGNQDGLGQDRLLSSSCGSPHTDDRIINGAPAPIGAYPWMAAMGYTQPGSNKIQFLCSGTIINSRYVLTAAHCLDPDLLGRRTLTAIHLGDYDLSTDQDCRKTNLRNQPPICAPPHVVVGFEETVVHPMYNKRERSSDDIALIRLNKNLDFDSLPGTIRPICLPPRNFDFASISDHRLTAAGWGLTEHGNNSNILLTVVIPLASDDLCKQRYKTRFVGNQLCVGGSKEGFDTCSGDSGGPLITTTKRDGPPFMQIGIVSFGPFPCGLTEFPGVYTSVSDYRDWIISNMKN